jgi:hypothetical protein
MLRDYQDIVSRLGKPLWWDDNGTPRYERFHPNMCGVYDRYVALLLIECQNCGTEYRVASERTDRGLAYTSAGELNGERVYRPAWAEVQLPTAEGVGSFHYGDPPPHCCGSGATMNSVPRRALEFWRKEHDRGSPNWMEWVRDPAHEVEWEEDDGWGFGPEVA